MRIDSIGAEECDLRESQIVSRCISGVLHAEWNFAEPHVNENMFVGDLY